MQGRQGRDSEQRVASLNGTGKQPTIPQRPIGMPPRVDQPPPTQRVARPQRETIPPKNFRRRLLILGSIFLVCALMACAIGYSVFNYLNGLAASSGSATTTSGFLNALSTRDYAQAYTFLGAAITISVPQEQFTQQAQSNDHCFGAVTNYTEVADSATTQGNSQSFTYNITRSKSPKPYQLRLTLQPDQEGSTNWKITSYGSSLGPGQPLCK